MLQPRNRSCVSGGSSASGEQRWPACRRLACPRSSKPTARHAVFRGIVVAKPISHLICSARVPSRRARSYLVMKRDVTRLAGAAAPFSAGSEITSDSPAAWLPPSGLPDPSWPAPSCAASDGTEFSAVHNAPPRARAQTPPVRGHFAPRASAPPLLPPLGPHALRQSQCLSPRFPWSTAARLGKNGRRSRSLRQVASRSRLGYWARWKGCVGADERKVRPKAGALQMAGLEGRSGAARSTVNAQRGAESTGVPSRRRPRQATVRERARDLLGSTGRSALTLTRSPTTAARQQRGDTSGPWRDGGAAIGYDSAAWEAAHVPEPLILFPVSPTAAHATHQAAEARHCADSGAFRPDAATRGGAAGRESAQQTAASSAAHAAPHGPDVRSRVRGSSLHWRHCAEQGTCVAAHAPPCPAVAGAAGPRRRGLGALAAAAATAGRPRDRLGAAAGGGGGMHRPQSRTGGGGGGREFTHCGAASQRTITHTRGREEPAH